MAVSRVVDWSKPRTWMLLGLLVAVLGAVVVAVQGGEGWAGPALEVIGGVMFVIGLLAYLVTQVLKAIEAGRGD